MPDPELLPPPPAKNKQIEDELLPPPPKKKGKGDSNNGATTLEAGSSVTPNPETEIPIVSLEPENSNSKLPDNTKNPIDLVADYGKLSNATKDVGVTGETQETLPDEGKTVNVDGHFFKVGGRKEADDLKTFLKDTHGIDADALYNETKDFPKEAYDWKMTDERGNEVQPYSKENLIKLRQENPTAYYDKINGVKTQYEIAKKTGSWNLANEFINLKRSAQNVDEFVDNVHKQKEIIGKVFDSFDEVQSANERLKSEAYTISPATKGFPESYKSSGLSEKLSPYEYAGLLTLKAFEPEKYKQTIDFINTPIKDVYHHQMPSSVTNNMQAPVAMSTSFDSPEKTIGGKAGSLSQGTIDQKIGLENRMMELSEIGKSNYFQSIQKNNKELDEQINKLDDNDINKSLLINQYNSNVNDLNKAISEGENDNARYPLSTALKFDRQVADMTQKDPGLLNTAAIKFALQTDKPRKAFENIFGDSPALQMQRLGEEESISQFTYLPEEYRRQNSPIIPVYPKELESAVKQISTDKDLSYEQKQSKIKDLLTANQSKIKIITNPNEGKSKNFFSKATAYTMADFFGNIGGMAFTMAGLPIKGIPKEVIGMGLLFHNDHFTEAVRKGYSNPNEYAALHSGIDMLAATFGTQYQAVKKMISGNQTAKNVLSEVTEDVWNKAVSKDRDIIGKLGGAIKSSLAENGKMVAMWGGAVPALHNVANNTFGRENKSTADVLDESFKSMKEMAIGQLPLALAGAYTGYKRESTLRKSLLWDIGDNADIELQRTKDLEATGKLTPEKAAQRTQTIKEVSRLVDLVPSTDKKGKPLTDDARIDYLYNLYIKNKAKTESGLPDKQKSEAEKTAMVADHLNNDILSSQTDIQLENRKKQIQKKLEEKDDEGKLVIKDKEKAELEAEKEAIELIAEERRNKPDTKLSEPIEGLDENGVPIPKGEPENISQPIELSTEPASSTTVSSGVGSVGVGGDVKQQELDAQKINKEAGVDVYVARQGVETNGEKYTLSQINENGNTNTFLIEDANGNEVGKAQLSADGNYLENIRIDEKHRRKGLASKVYDFIELRKGIELQPSPNKQSKEAKALWDNRNLKKSVSNKANGGLLAKSLGEAMSKTFADFKNKQQVLLELENKYFEQKGLSKEDFNKLSETEKAEIIKDAVKWKNDNPELVKAVEQTISKQENKPIQNEPASSTTVSSGEKKVYYRGQPDSELPNKDIFITPNEGMGTMYKGKDGALKKMNLSATNLFDMDTVVTKEFNDKLASAWKKANEGGDYKNETPSDIKDGSFIGKTYSQIHKEMPMFRRALEEMGYEGIENNFSHLKLEKNPRQEIIVFDKKHLHEIVGDAENKPIQNEPIKEGAESTQPIPTEEVKPTEESPVENIEPAAEGEEKVTGVKKAITDETRAANGMPKVEFAKMNSDIDALQEAKERVDSGKVNPQEMVNRILTEKGNYKNEGEVMDMQYYAHQLGKRSKELNQQLAEAKTPEQEADIRSQKLQLSDLMDAQTEAARTAGNQWGKTGNRMQPVINDAGDIFRNNKSDVVDAYGGEVPADVKVKLDAITKERDDAIAAKEKIEEQLRQKMAEKGFEKVKEQANKTKKRNEQKEALQKEAQDLINQLKDEIKGKPDDIVKQGLPITDKMVAIVGKLAVNYVKQGAVGLEALIDKVYESVKDHGITRAAVKSIIGNYEPVEVEREVNRLNKKAEILEEKLTPPTIKTKGNKFAPSEKTDLAKPSKEAKLFRTNNEWVKANQRVANAEFRMKIEKRKAFESQKNWYQRGLAWAGRLTRLSVLSGYNVLGKLAAAATIGAAGKRIPEQAIGAVYSTVFKGIAEKAPIEGFLNAKSEAKWYKEFFNPKKFAKNSMDILKTGSTDLGRRLGSAEYEHVPLLYLPTDLHQIIKDPVKRATFEASFRNGMIWAEKNGLDINDPLVINSLENAAYKRAQYEIFQEQNWLSKKFTSYKSSLEKAGNTGATAKFLVDFMIPVSTVPANIVRRVTTTSPLGLIRGGKEVVDAYRKGIEKLTPDEADHVMKQLKQGTLGTALWMVGWFGYQSFGGLYSQFNPNKKREEGDKVSDVMVIDDKEVPKPAQHALPLEVIQMAATARRIFENYKDNKNAETPKALAMAGLGAIGAGLEQIPVIETPIHAIMATKDPVEAEKLTEDIGRRFKPQILRETGVIGKKEATRATEFLDTKGLKIVDPHKQNLHPVDKDGNKVQITDEVFDNFKAKREEKIQAEINTLLDKGKLLYVNEEGKLIDKKVEDATEKEIQGWLMNKSTKATKDATEEIFGRQPEKQSKEYF